MHKCDAHHSRVHFGDQLDAGCRSKLFHHVPILRGHLQLANCFRRWTTSKNSTEEWHLRPLFPSLRIDSKTLVFSVSTKLACRALEIPVGRSTCAETELRSQDTVGSRHFRQNFVEPPFRMALCCEQGFDSKKNNETGRLLSVEKGVGLFIVVVSVSLGRCGKVPRHEIIILGLLALPCRKLEDSLFDSESRAMCKKERGRMPVNGCAPGR